MLSTFAFGCILRCYSKELRELLALPGVKVTVDPEDLKLEAADEADLYAQRPRRRAFEAITKTMDR